jgi:toxin FitB
MNLVDSSGWIEFLVDGPNAAFFAPPIKDTENLIVPVICLYEVFKEFNLIGDEGDAYQAAGQMKLGRIVKITEDIALTAAQVSIKHKLPLADSMIYTTARIHKAVLWTQDDLFSGLEGVKLKPASSR